MIDANTFLSGPRGRRFLLEFAMESSRLLDPEYELQYAVMHAAYDLDPGRGTSRVMIASDNAPSPHFTPADVAEILAKSPLRELTPSHLRHALASAVDRAMYWQEPEGEDVLIATESVRRSLGRFAEHIAQSTSIDWWDSDAKITDQSTIQWYTPPDTPHVATKDMLRTWQQDVARFEALAEYEDPTDRRMNRTGVWWSIPPPTLTRSSRSLFDGSPAGLWFVEDGFGENSVQVYPLHPPKGARIFEIRAASDWADLCRTYPLDVTAGRRHDWYSATGRVGGWVMPNWMHIAEEYDGVHLTVASYLSAAGDAIEVGENTASVIAGWNPDETWWFTDSITTGKSVRWDRTFTSGANAWIRG